MFGQSFWSSVGISVESNLGTISPETKTFAIVSSAFFLVFKYSDRGVFAVVRTKGSSTVRLCHCSLVMVSASPAGGVALCAFTAFTISGSVLNEDNCLILASSLDLISGGASPKFATAQMKTIRQEVNAFFHVVIVSP